MTKTLAEFKIQSSSMGESKPWKELPVTLRRSLPESLKVDRADTYFNEVARIVASATGSIVRWNFIGSTQGHYVEWDTDLYGQFRLQCLDKAKGA